MPFKPGQSGNPTGRKPGTRNKRLALLRSYDKRLQKKVVKMALQGDTACLKLCADRLWPRIRPQALPVQVDAANSDLASQGSAIIAAALSGNLAPDVRDLLTALADQARLVEFTAIEERLQKLENQKDAPPWEKRRPETKLPIRGRNRRLTT